ncbi:uncharacterized protein LOC128332031 isoform X3 [Hemicordylus capensis]|uniref:uncharacterized protein LOC128332031 isoform X3 n=1 Tax=Hemicordylus capensis TaxID=884348 RepID=UPI0023038C21|nr:uncharacterized protein LOC128332031 isoform X3 [Hemicordylus capensis]
MAQLVQVSQVPQMAEMDMLYSMGPAASVPTVHFVLMIFLQLFMRVGHHSHKLGAAAIGNCSNPCRITMEVLKLWRVTSPSGLHRVPVPKAMSFLSFNGNSLSKLQEGSLSRTHRDLSSNAIQTIEMNSREAVPFVQLIDLSGNLIEKLTPGAFEARHGMQFLLKMVLNHHPLKVIDDASFYRLPSLKLLNLSSTEMTPKILEDLLQTSQQLKTLILPNKIFCCLCRMKDDIEVLSDTIKLDCTDTCTTNKTLCEKDEALNRMQKEVMKALETRKLNASSTLNIVPEKLLHSNITMKVTVRQRNTNLGELNPHLLKSVQELEKDEALNRMQKEVMKALETRKLNASSTLNIVPEKLLHSNITMKVTVRQRNTNLGELNPHLLKSVQELEKDEALNRMQKEVMKALETRKLNASSTLNIVPEKLLHSNITMKVTVRQRNTNLGELNPHLLKSVQELEKDEALNRMQKEVMKALETRKLNASSTLNIVPEKLLHSNITMKVTVRQRNTNLGELNPHLLKSVQELEKDEALNRMQKEVMKALETRKLNASSTLNIVPEKLLHSNITMKVTVRQRNTNLGELNPHLLKSVQELEKDEALNRMQKEVMKALETRKLNASSTLNIVPEKLLHSNITMKVTVRQRNTNLGELNPHLLKSVQELEKDEALNRMQKEVMKALETRKLNASSTLNIVPEKLLHSNITMKVTVRQRNTNLGELNPHLLKSVQELEKDEALNRMQKEVMKALETRKLNASSTLNIVPEKLLHSNITMKVTVRQRNTNLGELNPHLLKSVQELEKDEALNRMQKEVMKALETRKLNASSTLNIVPEKLLHSNITMKVTVRQRNTNLGELNPHLLKSVQELEKDEALNRMQKEVMKALETRKLNASSTLNIVPEKLLHSNITMKVTVRQRNTNLGELNPHLLKSVQELEKDEALNRMQKEVMKALETRKLNASSTLNIVPEKLLHSNITMKVTVRQRNTNLGELNPHLLKSVQELGKLKPEEVLQIKWNDTSELKKLYMLANLLQMALREQVTEDLISYILIILKHVRESSQQDRSLHEEETAAPSTSTTTTTTTTTTTSTTSPTSQSLLLEGSSSSSQNEPSEGNSEQTSENAPLMSKEALLNQLTRGTQEGGVPQIPGDNAEAPQIPGDDTEASHETHWEHHEVKTTARHKLNILPTDDDYLLQGDLFEAELNKRLSPLIPNTPVRNLISHTLHILKMDCTVSRVQLACATLISRTGLLMKLFSERENFMDNSALWKSYFLSMKYVSNLATGSPRKLGKSEIGSQGIPEYGYGKKLLFAISVTAVIIIIISVIGLIESSSAGSSVLDKPLWLKDMYQLLDEVRKKSMVDKMHDEESSEDEDIFSWARVPGAPPGPPSPSPVEQPPSRRPSSRKMSAHPSHFAPQSAPPSVPPSMPMYMSPSVPPSLPPSVPPYITPYAPPSATPSVHPYVPPSVSPSIHQSVPPSELQSVPPSEYQSVPPSAPHSARPSVHQSAPPSAPPSAPHSAPHSARPSVPASVEGAPHTPSPKSSLTKPPSEASKRGSTAEGGASRESKKASWGAGSEAGGSKAGGSEGGGSATEGGGSATEED